MRLLLCNYEYPPLGGGGGVVMAALARELARRHEVFVLTSGGLGLPGSEVDSGVQVRRVPVWFRNSLAVANLPSMLMYLPSGLATGVKLLRQQRFDVINTHFVVPTGPLGAALATLFSVPNVVSVHGGDLYDPSKKMSPHRQPLLHPAIRRMLRRADAVVGQSRDTLERVRSIYHVDRATELIPLGIERPPPRSQDARQQLNIPESAFVMVAVGRVVARKAAPQLAEVLAGLRDPQALLLVVGDGPEAGAVLQAAAERGVAGQLRHLGQVSDATKYLALSAADVFVSTSQHEGFGLVFLEAMAFGLPVVCYDKGGQTDFLGTPHTGAVVKLNDKQAFIAAVDSLRLDAAARERISRHNLAKAENYFIDSCARQYEQVFENVLRARR